VPIDPSRNEEIIRPEEIMKRALRLCLLGGLLVAGSSAFSERDEQGFVRIAPEDIQWSSMPEGGGVQLAVIEGDPSKPGIYVIRIRFPPGVMTRNHFHPEDRHALVIEGTWWTGTGDLFDPERTVPLKPGSYMKHPAGAHHFDGAKGEAVIVQIIGYGPSETTFLRPLEGKFGLSLKK
jgi:quercetin dioxygenase-like cupin family protein